MNKGLGAVIIAAILVIGGLFIVGGNGPGDEDIGRAATLASSIYDESIEDHMINIMEVAEDGTTQYQEGTADKINTSLRTIQNDLNDLESSIGVTADSVVDEYAGLIDTKDDFFSIMNAVSDSDASSALTAISKCEEVYAVEADILEISATTSGPLLEAAETCQELLIGVASDQAQIADMLDAYALRNEASKLFYADVDNASVEDFSTATAQYAELYFTAFNELQDRVGGSLFSEQALDLQQALENAISQ